MIVFRYTLRSSEHLPGALPARRRNVVQAIYLDSGRHVNRWFIANALRARGVVAFRMVFEIVTGSDVIEFSDRALEGCTLQ